MVSFMMPWQMMHINIFQIELSKVSGDKLSIKTFVENRFHRNIYNCVTVLWVTITSFLDLNIKVIGSDIHVCPFDNTAFAVSGKVGYP